MSPAELSSVVNAFSGLAGALLWPAVVFVVIVRAGPVLLRKLDNSDQFTIKAAGVEASFERKRVESAAALGAAQVNLGEAADPVGIALAVTEALPTGEPESYFRDASILWVDDRPDNNRYERAALQALGIGIETATSTDEALVRLSEKSFGLIISDMGRQSDPQAGYTLLDQVRRSGNFTPYLIYAGSRKPEHVRQAKERGALGCTNNPRELVELATRALKK